MADRFDLKIRRYFGWFHPLLTWEHHCFGYRKDGDESSTVSDGYKTEVSVSSDSITSYSSEKTHVERYAYFMRHEEYPKNILFVLLEFLMTIVSVARVFLGKYLIIGYFLLVFTFPEFGFEKIGTYLGQAALIIYIGSFVIPILGFTVRKLFKLDERMDDVCDENGWQRWSEYEDSYGG